MKSLIIAVAFAVYSIQALADHASLTITVTVLPSVAVTEQEDKSYEIESNVPDSFIVNSDSEFGTMEIIAQ